MKLFLVLLLCFSIKSGLNFFEEDKTVLNIAAFASDSVSVGDFDDPRSSALYQSGLHGEWEIQTYKLNPGGQDTRIFGYLTALLNGESYHLIVLPDWKPGPDQILQHLSNSEWFQLVSAPIIEGATLPHVPGARDVGSVMRKTKDDMQYCLTEGLGDLLRNISKTEDEQTHVIFSGAGYGGALAKYVALNYGAIRYTHYRETAYHLPRSERFSLAGARMGILTFGGMHCFDERGSSHFSHFFQDLNQSVVDVSVMRDPKSFLVSRQFMESAENDLSDRGFDVFGESVGWEIEGDDEEAFFSLVNNINTLLVQGKSAGAYFKDIKPYFFKYSSRIDYAFRFFSHDSLSELTGFPVIEKWDDAQLRKRVWQERIEKKPAPQARAQSRAKEESIPPLPPRGRVHTLERKRIQQEQEVLRAQKAEEKERRKREAEEKRAAKLAFKEKQREVNKPRYQHSASSSVPDDETYVSYRKSASVSAARSVQPTYKPTTQPTEKKKGVFGRMWDGVREGAQALDRTISEYNENQRIKREEEERREAARQKKITTSLKTLRADKNKVVRELREKKAAKKVQYDDLEHTYAEEYDFWSIGNLASAKQRVKSAKTPPDEKRELKVRLDALHKRIEGILHAESSEIRALERKKTTLETKITGLEQQQKGKR